MSTQPLLLFRFYFTQPISCTKFQMMKKKRKPLVKQLLPKKFNLQKHWKKHICQKKKRN